MKTFFIEVDDDAGRDDAAPVIARCMAEYEASGRPAAVDPAPVERRDLLADVAAVLDGDEPVPVAELPPRLRQLAPVVLDEEYGYQVPSTDNRWPVNPQAVRAILADREAEAEEDE
jgi:S-DNA-T family DNA segregation ATPase FtsK/SpoIIIE